MFHSSHQTVMHVNNICTIWKQDCLSLNISDSQTFSSNPEFSLPCTSTLHNNRLLLLHTGYSEYFKTQSKQISIKPHYLALHWVVISRMAAPLRPMIAPTYSLGTRILTTNDINMLMLRRLPLSLLLLIKYNTAQHSLQDGEAFTP